MEKNISLPVGESNLLKEIRQVIDSARSRAMQTVNSLMVQAYWNVGRLIVEAQGGDNRAEYGDGLIKRISKELTTEFGKGFDASNLKNMRQFYLVFPKCDTLCSQLSWSHYRLIMRVQNPEAREFYISEAVKGQWSVRQLQRQINTFFYDRLLASRDKAGVSAELKRKDKEEFNPRQIIRDPYVLEFLDLKANPSFYEKDLEQGLIGHLQEFMLEMGRGFSFVGRQKRITFDGQHFYIDLVFYNYLMKCFVLVDLKMGVLTHQDIGQMQMYVNYYNAEIRPEGDNPTVGLLLCADKSDEVIRLHSVTAQPIFLLQNIPTACHLRRSCVGNYAVNTTI